MDVINIIILITAVFYFFLCVLVFFRNPKSNINRYVGLLALSAVAWSVTMIGYRMANSTYSSIIWCRFLYFSAAWIPVFNLLFTFSFLRGNKFLRFGKCFLIFLPALFISSLSLFSELIIKDVIILYIGEEKRIIFGTFYYIFYIIYISGYFLWSYVLLLKSLSIITGVKKSQMKFILIGLISASMLGMFTNLILPSFKIFSFNWLGQIATIFWLSSITYAITRYRLMDIRLIVVRSIAFGFIVLLITGIYATLSALVGQFFEGLVGIKSNILVGFIIALLVALGYSPIKRLIERATNTFLFKKVYDPDELIAEITDISTSILDLNNILASVAKALDTAFHPSKIAFTLLDKQGKLNVAYEQGFGKQIYEFTKGKEKVLPMYFKDTKQIYVIEELKTAYEQGDYQPKNIKLMYALYEMDVALIVPLFTKEKLIGLIAIGNKKSGDLYNKQDLRVLDIIGSQSAVGIENALLYKEQKQFGIRLEKTVAERTAQLRVANKKLKELDEAKSEFISIASHQLRTPLTVIKGYISMILEGSFGKTSKVIKDNLSKVYQSNERLIGLVEDLLNISRIESGRQEYNFKPINLVELAQTVYEELKQKAKDKGLKLQFHKPKKPLPKVVADSDKLHEVMINFTDNAVKYTPKGQIDMKVYQEGNEVIFAVKDTGIGMNEDDKSHLFKKFSRAKGTFLIHTEGTGLGLYVAKMIVQSHLGRIWAESEGRGKGSTFFFAIPVEGKGQKVGVIKQERIKSLDVKQADKNQGGKQASK